jgi:hypothetical protein
MNAKEPQLAQNKARDESGKDGHRKNEDKSLKESRHRHRRGSPSGNQAAYLIDAMIAQAVCEGAFWAGSSRNYGWKFHKFGCPILATFLFLSQGWDTSTPISPF